MPTKLFSLRLGRDTLDKLEALARETGATKSGLAQSLLEEGLRMESHPGIVFRAGPTGRRAALANGPDVWEIIPVVKNEDAAGADPIVAAAEYFGLPPHAIRAAVRYYAEYPDEIDERIHRNRELAERAEVQWRRERELLGR